LHSAAIQAQRATTTTAPGLFSSPEKRTVVLCLLLVAATLAVYNPVNRNAFVNFDDDHYITHNPHIVAGLSWDTVKWAFSNYYEANWHPLTWLSHALDCQLFGLNPVGHHYMNVFLHAANAMLLFWVLQSATGKTWRSWMVAALFALHPVNVESVAWASERKNVLSMMFLLLALGAYGWYARKPAAGRYATVAILFACGLMAKPQVITLPFVLLLWDYWPLERLESAAWSTRAVALIREKTPLFALALVSAVITMRAQRAGGAIHNFAAYSFRVRLENAIVSYARYIGKAFWPAGLSPLYPHPLDLLRTWQVIASVLLLGLITVLVIMNRRRGYLFTGWFWFVGTLVPMIGLIQVGEQAMADRYAYLPFVGLFLMVGWGVAEFAQRKRQSTRWLAVPAVAVLGMLGWLTYRQISYWRDSETLWSHALQVTSVRSYKAHFNLAMAYDQQGRFDEAIQQLGESIDPRDEDPNIHLGLGIYDQRHGHLQDAIAEFGATLRLTADPALKADAYSNLGSAYRQLHEFDRAKENFTAALRLNPNQATVLINMGVLAYKTGNYSEAIVYYMHAMSLEPTAVGYLLLAKCEEQAGHAAEAQAAIFRAKQLTTDWNQAQQAADQLLTF
jgi:protein O-mannosyl-transferase